MSNITELFNYVDVTQSKSISAQEATLLRMLYRFTLSSVVFSYARVLTENIQFWKPVLKGLTNCEAELIETVARRGCISLPEPVYDRCNAVSSLYEC